MRYSNCMDKRIRQKINLIYRNMKYRCYTKSCANYKNYGAKGIIICDEWRNNFEPFYIWSANNGYQEGLQIDRIENTGNYSPTNCRWVTAKINLQNRSNCQINQSIADKMREIYNSGECTNQTDIARMFNVSRQLVHLVVRNKRWI